MAKSKNVSKLYSLESFLCSEFTSLLGCLPPLPLLPHRHHRRRQACYMRKVFPFSIAMFHVSFFPVSVFLLCLFLFSFIRLPIFRCLKTSCLFWLLFLSLHAYPNRFEPNRTVAQQYIRSLNQMRNTDTRPAETNVTFLDPYYIIPHGIALGLSSPFGSFSLSFYPFMYLSKAKTTYN